MVKQNCISFLWFFVSILHSFHLYYILLCTSRSIQFIIVLAVPTGDSIKQMPESHNHNYYYCYYCFCWHYYYSKNKGKEALSFRCKHLFLGLLHALRQTFCYKDVEPVWNLTSFLQTCCLAVEISPNVFVLQQVSVLL